MATLNLTVDHPDHLPEAAAALGLDWQAIVQWATTHGAVIFAVFQEILNLRAQGGFDWAGVLTLIQKYGPTIGQFVLWVLANVLPSAL